MFKVTRTPTFWVKVKLRMPGEDGTMIEGEMRVQFLRKDRDELEKLDKSTVGRVVRAEAIAPYIHAWADYNNGEGEGDTPYSVDELKFLEQRVPSAPGALVRAYLNASAGAREGN